MPPIAEAPDRKRPTAGFWITMALVAVLVGYPLSIGPAVYVCAEAPIWLRDPVHEMYGPLRWALDRCPQSWQEEIVDPYLGWWVRLSK